MEPKILAELEKNSREKLRVVSTEFKGYDLVDFRVYRQSNETGDFVPTKKGLTFRREQLAQIVKLLRKAQREISKAPTEGRKADGPRLRK